MPDLSKIPIQQLREEIERRDKITPPPPQALATQDFSSLVKMIVEHQARTISDGYEDEDFPHHVYEAALEAVYGKTYWDWRNKQNC